MNIIDAFAKMEGWNADVANRPTRDHNPGDIEWGVFSRAHGATRPETMRDGSVGRFAYFPTPELGRACLVALLHTGFYATATIAEAINHYAPPVENNTRNYVSVVCAEVGCKPSDRLADVLRGAS